MEAIATITGNLQPELFGTLAVPVIHDPDLQEAKPARDAASGGLLDLVGPEHPVRAVYRGVATVNRPVDVAT